ncbi:MAG TPA: virulence factor [Gaiellales bacterium]|nr:virulence factor [Gaiellales bacterium]
MAEFRVTYWRDLPSLVTARDGERTSKAPLDTRFMIAIDEAAMRLGATDSDAYLEGWRQSEWEERSGSPEAVAQAVADELESEFGEDRVQEMLDSYGS